MILPMRRQLLALVASLIAVAVAAAPDQPNAVKVRGTVLDADSGRPLPCRIYVHSEKGTWYTVRSDAAEGSAVPYRKQRPENADSVEVHTALSAHPFAVDLPAGKYTITVERGKEYHPLVRDLVVGDKPVELELRLRRWTDLAARGWYSGDTHVHRTLEELPTAMLADDLNVTFPLLHWVTAAFTPPAKGAKSAERDPGPKAIAVDATHVIYPRNTEYEIFTVNKKNHTLGAFFVLNHRAPFEDGVPPVGPIAKRTHQEGGLIEMDKHGWPWSMVLVPVMPVDLFELTNNHVWRAAFAFGEFGEPPADYMKTERGTKGLTEWGWIDYGFQNYYALLDCGYRLRPTAGTASGVHPVPLGFGRVYVQLPDGFTYEAWVRGLNQGRSFVSTGPLLLVEVDGKPPGHTFKQAEPEPREYRLTGTALAGVPLQRIEVIVNGEIVRTLKPDNRKTDRDGYESPIDVPIKIDGSSWIAVRCFEDRPDRRPRFAHTGPFHIDVAGKPLRPRKAEVDFLIKRVENQIARSVDVLPEAALDEYRQALRAYQELAKTAW
jgi:hypothetical protein